MKDLIMMVGGIMAVLLFAVGSGFCICAHNEMGIYMMLAGMCLLPVAIWIGTTDKF